MKNIEILEQAGWTQEQMNKAGSTAVEITPEMGVALVDAYLKKGYLKFCNGTYYSQEDGVYHKHRKTPDFNYGDIRCISYAESSKVQKNV